MASLSKNKAVIGLTALTAALLLSGCEEYLNNWDTSSFRTGNASEANTAIQEIEPWPPAAYVTTVGAGG